MRAVNLIPVEERRNGGAAGNGLGSYIVLAVLALVVAMGAAYTLANRSVSNGRAELASVQAQAQAADAKAQQLASYTSFADLRQKRSATVTSLASSRFDWSHALHEVARTIPSNAWITSLTGTVAPGVALDGGGGGDPLRGSIQSPALELVGCTVSQKDVSSVISSLRRIDGVERVSLSSAAKLDPGSDSGSASGSSGASDGDCRHGNAHYPMFSMTLFFATPTGTQPAIQGTTP
jgi:Tfp pilus assembly protein PilN